MKGISITTGAAAKPAREAPEGDPTESFSNIQWFLHSCRNTIYYTAFQSLPFDEARMRATARRLVELAPQLRSGFPGARPEEDLTEAQWQAVTSLEEVDSLDPYPQKWLQSGEEVYDTPDVPLFRFRVVTRRGGTDEQGRASMVLVIASHALLEGSDSALLARSQETTHAAGAVAENPLPPLERVKVNATAGLMAIGHLAAGHLLAPPKMRMAFDAQSYSRHELRGIANKLGVNQRGLLYGTSMYALFESKRRKVSALYTILGGARHDADDEFIRARGIHAHFPLAGKSPAEFIRSVEAAMKRYEARPEGADQYVLNALYGIHRRVKKVLPFLYPPRFFRFPGLYDTVLTMTPPHRIVGSFMEGVIEPIYAGSHHEGIPLITFVPARKTVTINFTVPPEFTDRIGRVPEIIRELGAS